MTRKLTQEEARVLMLAAKLKPLEPYKSSGSPWKCRCQVCKSVCNPTLGNIRQGLGGCIKCGLEKRVKSRLLTDDKTIEQMLQKGLKPLEPYKTARSKWKCECLICHRVVEPSYWNTRNSKSKLKGCAFCVGVKVNPLEVQEKMLRAGLKTYGRYPGKDKPWKSKCLSCENLVFPTWNNIRNGAGGCGKCRYIKSGKSNSTPEKDAIARMLKAQLQPLEQYSNFHTPWMCICLRCKNTVYPTLRNIKAGQGGCAYCRETGLNYSDPAYIYLIFHEEYSSIKIGVSNLDSRPNRIKVHQKNGWSVYRIQNFKNGRAAEEIETQVLRWIRKNKRLPVHLSPKLMPQGGHSETVSTSEIALPTIWAEVLKQSKVKR
jgi:hypothetical protein